MLDSVEEISALGHVAGRWGKHGQAFEAATRLHKLLHSNHIELQNSQPLLSFGMPRQLLMGYVHKVLPGKPDNFCDGLLYIYIDGPVDMHEVCQNSCHVHVCFIGFFVGWLLHAISSP